MSRVKFGLLTFATALFLGQPASAQMADRLSHLKYVDLRDLTTYKTELAGTANLIMSAMEQEPARFVGNPNVLFHRSGPKGPSGEVNKDENGRDIYVVQNFNESTYKNAILSAELEDIVEEDFDKVFRTKMILFVHDPSHSSGSLSNGYFFRRMTVRVNWHAPKEQMSQRLQIISIDADIPMAYTSFQVNGDLLDRKVILRDSVYGIQKVFPIGVGSFDIRTGPGMDGTVRLMTDQFPGGSMSRANGGSSAPNTRSRTYPSYYRGRPFLSLFDNKGRYQQIGMHYQIDSSLTRGFVSHGCIRVRDKDLYQLDAIINEGPQEKLSANVLYHLPEYAHLDHPMPKTNDYSNVVVYSSKPSPETVNCQESSYKVRFHGQYHTVADGDCLTMVMRRNLPANDAIDYLRGLSFNPPQTFVADVEHAPIAIQLAQQNGTAVDMTDWASDGGEDHKVRQRKGLAGFINGLFGGKKRDRVRESDQPQRGNQDAEMRKAAKNVRGWQKVIARDCTPDGYGYTRETPARCAEYYRNLEGWRNHLQRLRQSSDFTGGLY